MAELRTEYMPLAAIQRAVRNPKLHDATLIRSSIDRLGFMEQPILDERTGRLVAGHGRLDTLEALAAEGADPPEFITIDDDGNWLVPVTRGWESRDDADADRAIVVLNRATEAGGWEPRSLASLLADLNAHGDGLDATGYDTSDLDDLLASLATDTHHVGEHDRRDPGPIESRYVVLIECDTEPQQRYLLERLMAEGLTVKALVS